MEYWGIAEAAGVSVAVVADIDVEVVVVVDMGLVCSGLGAGSPQPCLGSILLLPSLPKNLYSWMSLIICL